MVRGHLIQTCPGALGIHSNVLEYRHTVCRMNQNLLNKRRIKIHLISRWFVRVVPRHQESQAFGPEMKSGRHVDNHGRGVRKLIERLGRTSMRRNGSTGRSRLTILAMSAAHAPAQFTTLRVATFPLEVSTAITP